MKFLFFNLAVIGALAYLALKPSPHPESTPADPLQASTPIDQAKAAIEEVKRAAREASQDIKQLVASEIRKVGDADQKPKIPENDIDLKSGNQNMEAERSKTRELISIAAPGFSGTTRGLVATLAAL